MPGFSYTPLLVPVRVARKPKAREARKPKRLGFQPPLPLSLGHDGREYVLKPQK